MPPPVKGLTVGSTKPPRPASKRDRASRRIDGPTVPRLVRLPSEKSRSPSIQEGPTSPLQRCFEFGEVLPGDFFPLPGAGQRPRTLPLPGATAGLAAKAGALSGACCRVTGATSGFTMIAPSRTKSSERLRLAAYRLGAAGARSPGAFVGVHCRPGLPQPQWQWWLQRPGPRRIAE